MGRIGDAFSSFFGLLFGGELPEDVAKNHGYEKPPAAPPEPVKPVQPPKPAVTSADGALQMLGILQRDARLLDFVMEDISAYSDDQVGAAVRSLHQQARTAIERYVTLQPVIDGVEGTTAKVDQGLLNKGGVKLLGNVPASGKANAGVLRHRGWQASAVTIPEPAAKQDVRVLAPAEVEIE